MQVLTRSTSGWSFERRGGILVVVHGRGYAVGRGRGRDTARGLRGTHGAYRQVVHADCELILGRTGRGALGEAGDEVGGLCMGDVVLSSEEVDVLLRLRENMGEQGGCLGVGGCRDRHG